MMKYLRSSRDKEYIYNVICSRFSLELLKEAREIIYTHNNLSEKEKYAYRGPYGKPNPRDHIAHAFDGICAKMDELDSNGKMPIIACPSEDMALLLSLHTEPIAVDDRFKKLEKEVRDMKSLIADIASSGKTSERLEDSSRPAASGIHPGTRSRLLSESHKRRRTEDGEVAGSDSETESVEGDGFSIPRAHQKKLERQSYRNQLLKAPSGKPQEFKSDARKSSRPKPVWGKSKAPASENLSGSPPEIFMVNCRRTIEEENVRIHFASHSIDLVQIKKASHADARKNSFILTVANREDYHKIMSGDLTPEDVGVRQYFRRRQHPEPKSASTRSAREYEAFLRESSLERSTLGIAVSKSNVRLDTSGHAEPPAETPTPEHVDE